MTKKRIQSAPTPSGEPFLDGKEPGFTLVEFLIAISLLGVIMASTVGLLMSQRSLYNTQGDRMALQQSVRASVDVVASELRTIPPEGVIQATPDSITVHYPIRWGLVCGPALDGGGAGEMFMRGAEDALFADQVQVGYGVKEPDGTWVFHEESGPIFADSFYAESLVACKEGAGAKVQSTTTYNKDGSVNSYADTTSQDYPRIADFAGTTGSAPVATSQFILYTDITYRFGPSAFQPGTRALFRNMPGAEQELTGLFSSDAGFEYVLEDGTVTDNVGVGNLGEVVEVRIKALGFKETNTSGIMRGLEYDATVAVPLRNVGG